MTTNLPKAEHYGDLDIGDRRVKCAVLGDGTRLISRATFIRAIGRKGKAKGGRDYDEEFKLPVFLTANNLNPYISKELVENSQPILFSLRNKQSIGYKAELLSQVCYVFIDADEAGVLNANQKHIAHQCRILVRSFATIGLIALIDEATGYQEVRDRKALQALLDKYLRKELAAWAKRFPDEFYKEIFRLKNWQWQGMKINRPSVVGTYTKDVVYERLAPGILEELEKRNPKDERGRRPAKHHQWLTEDIGNPALAQHLHAVMGLMRAAPSWTQFYRLLQRAFPKKGENIPLLLE